MTFIVIFVVLSAFILLIGLSGGPDPVTTFHFPLDDDEEETP